MGSYRGADGLVPPQLWDTREAAYVNTKCVPFSLCPYIKAAVYVAHERLSVHHLLTSHHATILHQLFP